MISLKIRIIIVIIIIVIIGTVYNIIIEDPFAAYLSVGLGAIFFQIIDYIFHKIKMK